MTAVALIVHARGEPDYLDLCLASLYGQKYPEFEILVTDVGKDNAFEEVVAHHAAHMHQRVRHIKAPGGPGNLALALNAAMLATTSEYLVFLGGDCLAQPEFISAHVGAADYGYFAYAETLPLDAPITAAIDARALGSGLAFEESWLLATSPEWHAEHLRGSALGKLKEWLRKDTPGQRYWNVECSSCFRDELLAVNGFDRDVDDWRLETDAANRLQNNGLEPVKVRAAGNVLKLYHKDALVEQGGGRLPTPLEPGGEVRAVNGIAELTAEADAA